MGAAASCVSGGAMGEAARAQIVEVLRKTPFMQLMDDKILQDIAECFQLVRYPRGATVKNEPWLFFIVAEGSVDISSLLPTATRKQQLQEVLCQRKVGDHISFAAREQVLGRLLEDQVRLKGAGTSAKAKTAKKNLIAMLDLNRITADPFTGCTLLKLQRDRFFKLRSRTESRKSEQYKHTARYSGESQQRRAANMTRPEKLHLINSIIESEVVNFLYDIPFLDGVEESRLVTLSNLCSYQFIRRGDVLCEEGEIGDRFFICINGSLQASVTTFLNHNPSAFARTRTVKDQQAHRPHAHNKDKRIQALKRMGTGAYFGEISLMFKIPRICSITALEDSLLVFIERVAFCNFLKIVPEASLVLLEHVRMHFLDTLIKQGCTFLHAIPPMKLQELSFMSELLEFQNGATIVEVGETAAPPAFFIVLRGEVEIEYFPITKRRRAAGNAATAVIAINDVDGDADGDSPAPQQEIVRVRAGGYFGQEALILGVPSPIRVRCLDHCLVLRLSAELFDEFFASLPELYSEFCIKCLRERSRLEHVMQHYESHKLWAADCVTRRRHHEVALFEQIEDFKWEAELTEDRIHERALVVYMRFLADNAPLRVKISRHTVDRLEDELSSQSIDRTLFEKTREELLVGMEDDDFERFKQSIVFQDFLASLHCPQTIYDGLTTEQIARLDMNWRTKGRAQMQLEDLDEDRPLQSSAEPAVTQVTTFEPKHETRTTVRRMSGAAIAAAVASHVPTTAGGETSTRTTGRRSVVLAAGLADPAAQTGSLSGVTRRKTKSDLSSALQRTLSSSFVF
ncbi:hypothetical protein P43SY_005463 [Pythium insidiosum]|uniref:Cyclic nucleotide-binding domain-containing protein n=1 Tax=Pythium insidiosum TaxID=114742 RepID=A0AAD5M3B7_PYTIN|nr:hypothetical protein P43SY_005463 [Pythium insidiosum]